MSSTASTETLVADLKVVIRDAEALLQATAAQTGERIEGVRAQAAESLNKARQRLASMEQEAVREVRQAAQATDAYVHKNPWEAVGMGVGVGLIVGLLIGRR